MGASRAKVRPRTTNPNAVTVLYARALSGKRSTSQPTGTETKVYTIEEYRKKKESHASEKYHGGPRIRYASVGSSVATTDPDSATDASPRQTESESTSQIGLRRRAPAGRRRRPPRRRAATRRRRRRAASRPRRGGDVLLRHKVVEHRRQHDRNGAEDDITAGGTPTRRRRRRRRRARRRAAGPPCSRRRRRCRSRPSRCRGGPGSAPTRG